MSKDKGRNNKEFQEGGHRNESNFNREANRGKSQEQHKWQGQPNKHGNNQNQGQPGKQGNNQGWNTNQNQGNRWNQEHQKGHNPNEHRHDQEKKRKAG